MTVYYFYSILFLVELLKKGCLMATPRWTSTEEELGRNLIAAAKKFSGTFLVRFSKAALMMGYKNYGAVPRGAKSFVSSVGGTISGKQKKDAPSVKKKVVKKPFVLKEKTPEELWYEELQKSTSMRHGLHPEDESHILQTINNESSFIKK